MVLDDQRTILAEALQGLSAGMVLEQALHELCEELATLESQDAVLSQQIIQETKTLNRLEQKVGQISGCRLDLFILSDTDRVHLYWRWVPGA